MAFPPAVPFRTGLIRTRLLLHDLLPSSPGETSTCAVDDPYREGVGWSGEGERKRSTFEDQGPLSVGGSEESWESMGSRGA